MPKLFHVAPKYRKHKASGQAIVTINGQDDYLGPWRSKASRREYDRLIAEWLARGRVTPQVGPDSSLSVMELLQAYLRWAKRYYVGGSREVEQIVITIRPLKELYGRTMAADFGPLALKAVRQRMIDLGLCRTEINKRTGRVKRVFKWGVENELLPPSVFHGLQAVRGLSRGRSEARESEPVKPVPEAFVDAVKGYVAPQVWAMIELQRLSGMRPGEVTRMRMADLDIGGPVWVYTPAKHKTEHHGHRRQIYLGPRAQAVVRPWLRTDLDGYLFQPKEAMDTVATCN
jgi:integrase